MLEREAAKVKPVDQGIVLTAELMEAFVKKFLAHKFDGELPTPDFHREMWTKACSSVEKSADAAPRGHAKSTSITFCFTLAALLFRFRDFAPIISDTWGQSVEFLREIKSELTDNDELREAFHVKRFLKESEDDLIVQMEDGYKFRLVARGAGQKVRGLKWNKKRPNLIVIDDLDDDETVMSKDRRDKLFDWFVRALIPCGAHNCIYRMVGTVLHDDSVLARVLKSPDWNCKIYSAHKSFNDFSEVLWPEHMSAEKLRAKRDALVAQGKADAYSSEYLNKPIAEGDSFFDPDFYLPMDDYDRKRHGTHYVGWDMAVSIKQKTDFTVAAIFKVDSDGYKHLVEVRRGRLDGLAIIDEMFSVQEAYQPACHFGEKGVIDAAITPFLNAEMQKRQKYLNLIRIARTKEKGEFARPLQAMMKARHVKFDKDISQWPEVEEELKRFPKGVHDDIVDALAIVGQGLSQIVSVETTEELEEEDYRRSMVEMEDGRSETTGY